MGSRERRALITAALLVVGGLVVLRFGFGPFELQAGVLVVLAGWFVGAAGLGVWLRAPASGAGLLLVAVAVTWLLASLQRTPFALLNELVAPFRLVYAAFLGHAVLVLEDRPPRAGRIAIAGAYAASPIAQPLGGVVVSLVLSLGLGTVAVARIRRRSTAWATVAGVGFAATLGVTTVARWWVPSFSTVDVRPALEVALMVAGGVVAATAVRAAHHALRVSDLVVELGREAGGAIARQLSSALGDPTLEVFFALGDGTGFVDASGRDVLLPTPGSGRGLTLLERGGRPIAALVHDPALRIDPAVRSGIARAAELAAANARLQAVVQAQLIEVAASRRRLLDAADEERRLLRARLDDELGAQFDDLETMLTEASEEADRASVAAVLSQLGETRSDVAAVADGLHPRLLDELGLAGALRELGRRSAIPVDVAVPSSVDADLASQTALYFVSSEALANATKHANASVVYLRVTQADGALRVEIEDDGIGGADPALGTGLRGLHLRVEALGGWLSVSGRPGQGTRIVASVPTGR